MNVGSICALLNSTLIHRQPPQSTKKLASVAMINQVQYILDRHEGRRSSSCKLKTPLLFLLVSLVLSLFVIVCEAVAFLGFFEL